MLPKRSNKNRNDKLCHKTQCRLYLNKRVEITFKRQNDCLTQFMRKCIICIGLLWALLENPISQIAFLCRNCAELLNLYLRLFTSMNKMYIMPKNACIREPVSKLVNDDMVYTLYKSIFTNAFIFLFCDSCLSDINSLPPREQRLIGGPRHWGK